MGSVADIAVQCLTAVYGNAAVQAFCQAAYGRGPTLIYGIDPENPPGQGSYPIVTVVSAVRGASLARNAAEYNLGFLVAVNNDALTTSGGVTRYTGMVEAGDLAELVEFAVVGQLRQQFPQITIDAEIGIESDYPLFGGVITITATAAGSRRASIYA